MTTPHSSFLAGALVAAFLSPLNPALAQAPGPAPRQPQMVGQPAGVPAPLKVAETTAVMRDLWVGHVFWVRNVVIGTLDGNKAAAAVAEKEVVTNARAIANSIEPYYGKEGSDKLFTLLQGHYGAIKQHLDATVGNSKPKQEAAQKAINANATEIARFLSGANPNLPFDNLNGLMLAHGVHHVAAINQAYAKKFADEAQTWEAMKRHIYVIADALAGGIAKQFPNKFS